MSGLGEGPEEPLTEGVDEDASVSDEVAVVIVVVVVVLG